MPDQDGPKVQAPSPRMPSSAAQPILASTATSPGPTPDAPAPSSSIPAARSFSRTSQLHRLAESPRPLSTRFSPIGTPVGSLPQGSQARRASGARRPSHGVDRQASPRARTEGFQVASGSSMDVNARSQVSQAGASPNIEAAWAAAGELLSGSPGGQEDPRIVDRHLGEAATEDEFASLQLQGGDVHRQVYQWSQQQKQQSLQARRSQSFYIPRPQTEDETLDPRNLKVPGGFRRQHLAAKAEDEDVQPAAQEDYFSAGPAAQQGIAGYGATASGSLQQQQGQHQDRAALRRNQTVGARPPPQFLTRNFIEFLSLYGHFAGEDLEEVDEDEDEGLDESEAEAGFADAETETEGGEGPGEGRPLLMPRKSTRKTRKPGEEQGDATVFKAVLLLLKSFVGTGVLFLPKAFLNGGMLFSSIVLLAVSAISLYCFLLLVNTRLAVPASFGDIGGILYGKAMRNAILFSIAISQIGFVCAYTAFTAENLGAFIKAVTNGRVHWDISWLILIQLVLFLPLSMIRDISKLGFTALIADFFILLGLVYLYYADISQISTQGVADIVLFNSNDWTLFIGTSIFTFEGIGLLIPITQSMKEPEKFPAALGGVMLFITVLFTSIGALSYAAFGSDTKTVILSNLPQSNRFVNGVQLLYSIAILLSTPLQLFPAIRILETALFTKSGKYSPKTKWTKNLFRIIIVIGTSFLAWVAANDLDKFVSVIGSFACVPLVYIYPPLLHYAAVSRTRIQKGADIVMAIFGVLAMVYTTGTSIGSWIGH